MCTTPGECAVVQEAVQRIEARHHQIHVLQTRLSSQMLELNGRWPGRAALLFQREYSQFDTEFERVKQGLDRMHTVLVETQHVHERGTDIIDVDVPYGTHRHPNESRTDSLP